MHGLAIDPPTGSMSRNATASHALRQQDHDTQHTIPSRRPGIAGKLAWCAAGFLIGAAFWHAVGFWGFISMVVLEGPGPQASLASARLLITGSINQTRTQATLATSSRPSCITLSLDRTTGKTRPEPCDTTAPPLPHVAASPREDLALLPSESSLTISPYSAP